MEYAQLSASDGNGRPRQAGSVGDADSGFVRIERSLRYAAGALQHVQAERAQLALGSGRADPGGR